jgi:two-component system response regulator YesN
LRDHLNKYRTTLTDEHLQLLVFCFEKNIFETGDIPQESVVNSINKILAWSFNPLSVFFNGLTCVTLLNCLPAQVMELQYLCQQIILQINHEYQLNLWILETDELTGFSNIYCAFQQALKITPFCFYKEKNQVFKPGDFVQTTSFIEVDYKNLNLLIEKFDFSGVLNLTNSIPAEMIRKELFIEPYSLRKYFSEICYNLIYKLDEFGFSSEKTSKQKFIYFKQLEGSVSYQELLDTFATIIEDIKVFVEAARNNKINPTIQKIIAYIHQNYHQEISLNAVAEVFHLNKSYLCQLFKQQTGENFNDYLVKIRMDKAKELLRNPEHNVYTVCNLVGFSNPSYFGQVFKNVVGMPPSEYTKLFIKSNQDGAG